jgi:FMN phosphatase YigB (HAD superfamily)
MGLARRIVAFDSGPLTQRPSLRFRPAVSQAAPPRLAQVRGVLFELGNVLYDATLWRRWFANLLGRIGLPADFREFFAPWDAAFAPETYCGRQPFAAAFRQFLQASGLTSGQIDEIVVACASKRRDFEDKLCPFPGVRGTLLQLCCRGLRLGVLTDSEQSAEQLEARLERMHLAESLAVVVSSRDLGRAKPAMECYQAAAEAIDLPPAQLAFVGVREADLAGAAASGLHAVSAPGGANVPAAIHVHRFDDIGLVFGTEEPLSLAG